MLLPFVPSPPTWSAKSEESWLLFDVTQSPLPYARGIIDTLIKLSLSRPPSTAGRVWDDESKQACDEMVLDRWMLFRKCSVPEKSLLPYCLFLNGDMEKAMG